MLVSRNCPLLIVVYRGARRICRHIVPFGRSFLASHTCWTQLATKLIPYSGRDITDVVCLQYQVPIALCLALASTWQEAYVLCEPERAFVARTFHAAAADQISGMGRVIGSG